MTRRPPRLATWLLRRCLPDDAVGASIRGDLREEYELEGRPFRYVAVAVMLAARYAGVRLLAAVGRLLRGSTSEVSGRSARQAVVDDIRDAARGLLRRPLFAAAGIALLACGLAATSIVASFVDAVLLRPLPGIDDAGSLVRIEERVMNPEPGRRALRDLVPADMEWIAAASPSLAATATMLAGGSIPLATPNGATRVPVLRATAGFFDVLGVQPAIGARFTRDDEDPGRPPVALLSHSAWRRLFGGRPDAIGSTLTLNRQAHTVIGVMPRGFSFTDSPDVYLPLTRSAFTNRFHVSAGIARVRPGVTMDRVRAEVEAAVASLAADDPGGDHGTGARVTTWREAETERVRLAMQLLMAAAAVVLMLAVANLAGLLADRTMARAREIKIRRSLGATSATVTRLLIAEGILISVIGAAVGLGIAALTLRGVVWLSPADLPFRDDVRLDLRVMAFTGALALLAGIVAGVVPSLGSGHRALAAGERAGGSAGTSRGGRALVVAQIAAAMVLVFSAGLLIRSFVAVLRVDPGVRVEGILTAAVSLNERRFDEPGQRVFFEQAVEQLRGVPGVTAVELSLFAPLSGAIPAEFSRRVDDTNPERLFMNAVSPGLLPLLRLPVVEGRGFEDADDERRPRVAVISRLAAAALFPDRPALGRTIVRGKDTYRIVGVVADARQEGLLEEPRPMVYVPFRQLPFNAGTFVATADVDPALVYSSLRKIVHGLDPALPLDRPQSLASIVDKGLAQPRFYSVVVGTFGVIALALAVSGLYATIAFATTRRLYEFGVRSALGARPIDNLWTVYRQGIVLALAGITIGALVAIRIAYLLESLLYRTKSSDPAMLLAAAALMLAVTLAAVVTPAMRAARVDPIVALRAE